MISNLFLQTLPLYESIQNQINSRYQQLFYTNDDGKRSSFVCAVCNEFILNEDDIQILTETNLKK